MTTNLFSSLYALSLRSPSHTNYSCKASIGYGSGDLGVIPSLSLTLLRFAPLRVQFPNKFTLFYGLVFLFLLNSYLVRSYRTMVLDKSGADAVSLVLLTVGGQIFRLLIMPLVTLGRMTCANKC